MFQLIVAVISIALIAALAIASIFYGGDAFTKSSEKANVTTLVNQAQQISGAAALYKTDNGVPVNPASAIADLISGHYLANEPKAPKIADGTAWAIENGNVVVPFVNGADLLALCGADAANPGVVWAQGAKCVDDSGVDAYDGVATKFAFPL